MNSPLQGGRQTATRRNRGSEDPPLLEEGSAGLKSSAYKGTRQDGEMNSPLREDGKEREEAGVRGLAGMRA